MKKFLVSSFLCLFPSLLLADSLTPPPTDLSMSYLATIFGVVDGVLHGTGSEIIGTMFGAFNSIILVMASVILSYVLFISILNTSHEGEFLGKKWSSIWVPLRTVAGVGLLLPKATGYSFVQIIVMWVVVQGVGAADQVWNVALNYMNRNGTIVEPIQSLAPKDGSGPDNSFLIGKAGDILKSEVCMLTVHNALVRQYKDTGVTVPDFMSSLAVTGKGPNGQDTIKPLDYTQDKGGFISFPGILPGAFANLRGLCGNVSWDFIGKNDSGEVYNPAHLNANDSASIAARQMTLDLGTLAQSVADQLAPPYATSTLVPPIKLSADNPIFKTDGLVDPSDNYFTIVKPALRSLADDASKKYKAFITQAKDTGWILAGSYYYNMARLNQSIRKNTGQLAMSDKISPSFNPNYTTGSFTQINDPNVIANLKTNLPSSGGVIDNYVKAETAQAANNNNPGRDPDPSLPTPENVANVGSLGDDINKIFNIIFPQVSSFEHDLADNINNKDMDPIFALVSVGNGLVTMVEHVWIGILSAIVGLCVAGIALGFGSGFWTVGGAVNTMLTVTTLATLLLPMITLWMGINFVLGSVLSYYVPLIPFFLFTFGAITWFAVVLEAIIAAPLVALGITHPEGHDFLGKAEQSVMLLASVFLRPVLMVFGFIFGIILSFAGISLFNRGFSIAVQFLTEYNGDIFSLVYQTAMMAIYSAAILAIVNRSFSMIYEVPNKVLRWIGGPQESGHEESMLQGIRGQHDRDVGQITQQITPSAQDTIQGVGGAASGGKAMGTRVRDLKKTSATASTPGDGNASA